MCKRIHKRGKTFGEHKIFASEDKRRLKRIRELEEKHLSKKVPKNKRRKKIKIPTTKKKQRDRHRSPKKRHGHYIIMLNERPGGQNFPDDRMIKVGYGNAKERIKQYRTTLPYAYIYRYWIHHKNIERDLLDITRAFGKRDNRGKGREVFIIHVDRLKMLVKHYDESVFDEIMK